MASQQHYSSYGTNFQPIQHQQQQQYQPIQSNHISHISNTIPTIPTIPPIPSIPSYPFQNVPSPHISYNTARAVSGHGLAPPCTPQYHPFPPLPPTMFLSPMIEPQTNTKHFPETKTDYAQKKNPVATLTISTPTSINIPSVRNNNTTDNNLLANLYNIGNNSNNNNNNNNSEFMIPINNDYLGSFDGFNNGINNNNNDFSVPFDPNRSFFGGMDNMTDYVSMDGMINDNFNLNDNKMINNYKCPECPRTFQHKSNLTIHLKMHSPSALICQFCGKRFARDSNLRQHRRVHTNERPFKCPHCYKSFKQQHSLADHVRIHTGEKPHKCEFCAKAFAAKCNLIVHRRIHTGERPYKCDHCHKKYASKSGYNSHRKKYHPYQIDTNLF